MYFLALGLALLALKAAAWGPAAAWNWWLLLIPFGMAALWWAWADATGYNRRQVVRREQRRYQARIDRHLAEQGRLHRRGPASHTFSATVQ